MQLLGRLLGGAFAVGAVAFASTASMDDNTTRDANGSIIESGGLGVFRARVGDCVNLPGELSVGLVQSVEGVSCDDPHEAEVYHQFTSLLGPEWPGQEALASEVDAKCYDAFAPYVGSTPVQSDLYVNILSPTEEGWTDGRREVTCLAFQMEGLDLVSTIRNSQR